MMTFVAEYVIMATGDTSVMPEVPRRLVPETARVYALKR